MCVGPIESNPISRTLYDNLRQSNKLNEFKVVRGLLDDCHPFGWPAFRSKL